MRDAIRPVRNYAPALRHLSLPRAAAFWVLALAFCFPLSAQITPLYLLVPPDATGTVAIRLTNPLHTPTAAFMTARHQSGEISETVSFLAEPGVTERPLDSLLDYWLPGELLLLEIRPERTLGGATVLYGAGPSLEVVPAAIAASKDLSLPIAHFDYVISNASPYSGDVKLEILDPEGLVLASTYEPGLGEFETRHLDLRLLFQSSDIEAAARLRLIFDRAFTGFAIAATGFREREDEVLANHPAATWLQAQDASFIWPVAGDDRSRLGNDYAQYNYVSKDKHHTGIDIGATAGTEVLAAGDGAIVEIQENDVDEPNCGARCDHGYGNTIIVQHSLPGGQNIYTQYSHLSWIDPKLLEECGSGGDRRRHICTALVDVSAGEVIGKVGCTRYGLTKCDKDFGPHLHFETKTFASLGTVNDDKGEFGYTTRHPQSHGYKDPLPFLHQLSPRSGTVRLADSSVCLRVGPGGAGTTPYRAIGCGSAVTSSGPIFTVLAVGDPTSKPRCQKGWYQVAPIEGDGFPDVTNNTYGYPNDTIPEAWICGDFLDETTPGRSIEFSTGTFAISEESGSATISVVRKGDVSSAAAVTYSTSNGTALRGNDYRPSSGVLGFEPGQASKTFSVVILDDIAEENDETVNLTLSAPTGGASLGPLRTAAIIIADNDRGPKVAFSSEGVNIQENAGNVAVTVNRTGPAGGSIDVGYSTESGSATGDRDFRPQSGRITFDAGVTSRVIIIPILDDNSQEGSETFSLRLFEASWGVAIGAQDRTSVTIIDDETAVAAPSIDRLSPISYPRSSSHQTMTIHGNNFQNGITLTLDPPMGPNIVSTPDRLSFVSTSQLSYQFAANVSGTWTVTAKNPDGQPSNTINFTVTTSPGSTLPATPTNTNPGTSTGPGPTMAGIAVKLSWSASAGATSYSLGVRDMITNQLVVDTATSGTTFTPSLSAGRQYRWNVAACNSAGCSSFTDPLYFQTPSATSVPPTPTNISPGSTSSPGPTTASTTVTLSWSPSSGATSYSLGVRDMSTNQLVIDTTASGTSYTDSLSAGRQYRWNVAACSSAGCSAFTAPLYFQTPGATSAPPVPTNTSPGSTSSPGPAMANTTITLSWSPSSGATSYSLGVRDMSTNQLVIDATTSGTSYTDSLSAGRQYRWNVAACNSAGCSSFTTPLYFQTPGAGSVPSTPSGTSPGSTSSPGPTMGANTVALSWNASTGATSYSFGVRDMTTNQLVVDTTTSNTSFTATLSAGRQYRWNVAACNSAGCSSFTTPLYFQTPGTASAPSTPSGTSPGSTSSPGPTMGGNMVTMSWNASTGATNYSFGVRDMTTNQLVVDTTTSNTSFTASLSAGKQYRWNVAACNSAGCSSFTTPLYFQTPGTASAPSTPSGTSPGSTSSPGPTMGGNMVTMSWNASTGATNYSFGVRDMTTNQLVVDTTTSNTSFTASLSAGRQYRWNVAACNSAGCSSFTTPLYFQTPGSVSAPSTPSGTSPGSTSSPGPTMGGNTVTMSWNASTGATNYSFGVRDMTTNQLVVDTTTSNTSFTASLSAGRQYRWNVAACNSAGCSSFTTPLYFQTPGSVSVPSTPSGTSPGSTSSPGPTMGGNTVTMSWNASTGATNYSFGVRDMTTNQLVVDTTTSNTSFTASLSAGRRYRWNVAACNSAGCSSFTTSLYFQTPGTISVPSTPSGTSPGSTSSPGPTMSGNTVTMSWNTSTGATSYSFGVRDMTTNQLVVDTTTSNTSFTASLSAGRRYRWNVAACNSAGCSSFTTPLYFQTP